jgi:hypothetical protein
MPGGRSTRISSQSVSFLVCFHLSIPTASFTSIPQSQTGVVPHLMISQPQILILVDFSPFPLLELCHPKCIPSTLPFLLSTSPKIYSKVGYRLIQHCPPVLHFEAFDDDQSREKTIMMSCAAVCRGSPGRRGSGCVQSACTLVVQSTKEDQLETLLQDKLDLRVLAAPWDRREQAGCYEPRQTVKALWEPRGSNRP